MAVVRLVTAIIGLLWSLVTALSYSCQEDVATVWKKIFYNIYSDITTSEVKAQNEDKHMMLQTMFIIHIFLSLLDNYWSGIVPFTDIKISSSEQLLVFFIYSRHMTIIISSVYTIHYASVWYSVLIT